MILSELNCRLSELCLNMNKKIISDRKIHLKTSKK